MNTIRKNTTLTFLFVVGYAVVFYILNLFLFQREMIQPLPAGYNRALWDGGWFSYLMEEGYIYKRGWQNAGFYPLFPLIWRSSYLGPVGISLLNVLFLAGGITILATIVKPSFQEKFLWLSTPSFYFCFVPHEESLFMLLASALIYGIWKSDRLVIWSSLLLLGWVRPVAIVLIPALVLMELISNDRRLWFYSLRKAVVNYALPLSISAVLFTWYQHRETGAWLGYFQQYSQNLIWKFSWPALPFNSSLGPRLLWLNAVALFVSLVSIWGVLKTCVNWLTKMKAGNKILLLSFLFLAGIGLVNILFNPHDPSGYTNVFGSHRYVFVSPFFLFFLHHFTYEKIYRKVDYIVVFMLSNIVWLCFASYIHIMYLVYFNFCTAIMFMYMLRSDKRLTWPAMVIAAINIFVQVHAFQFFIQGIYTD